MRILITGISGFVARHFVEYLATLPGSFHVLGVYNRHYPEFREDRFSNVRVRFKQLDLLENRVSELICDFKPDWFLHLGSRSSVVYSWKHPAETIRQHISIFTSIIECLRKQNPTCRLLSVGSAEEYGIVAEKDLPITEMLLGTPASPYGISRQMQQNLAEVYTKSYGLDIVHTRSFNHIGPYQSSDFVLSSFARQIVTQLDAGKKEIEITVGNIDVTRDFTDVRDVVKAYYMLLLNGRSGEVYNVCSGRPVILKQLLKTFERLTDAIITSKIEPLSFHPSENKQVYGSYEKVNRETGWSPQIPMEKTLDDLMGYWRSRSDEKE